MKKVLFATSALVAASVAGAASADVVLSGSAEMGIIMIDTTGAAAPNDGEVRFHHDLDVKFTLSGSNDNGLTFGATIDLDEVGDDAGGDSIDNDPTGSGTEEHSVFISGNFGTLTMGDTDGAFDQALTEIASGGINDETDFYVDGNGGLDELFDGQVARYDYSFGDLTASISAELDDGTSDAVYGVGVSFSTSFGGTDIGIGLGYQTGEVGTTDYDIYGISLSAGIAGFDVVFNYSHGEAGSADRDHLGVSAAYTFGDVKVSANYNNIDFGTSDVDGYGIWVDYNLGGGATLTAAYGVQDFGTVETSRAGLGVSMSF